MILGHSELPPRALTELLHPEPLFLPCILPVVRALFFPRKIFLEQSICRALAEYANDLVPVNQR